MAYEMPCAYDVKTATRIAVTVIVKCSSIILLLGKFFDCEGNAIGKRHVIRKGDYKFFSYQVEKTPQFDKLLRICML